MTELTVLLVVPVTCLTTSPRCFFNNQKIILMMGAGGRYTSPGPLSRGIWEGNAYMIDPTARGSILSALHLTRAKQDIP